MIPSFCRSVPEPDREGDQSNQGEDTEAESYILRVCVLVPTGQQAATRPQYSKSEQRNESETYLCQYDLMKIIQEDLPHVKIKENSNQIHELQKPSNKPPLTLFGQKKNKTPSGNQSFRVLRCAILALVLSRCPIGFHTNSNYIFSTKDECPLSDERLPV